MNTFFASLVSIFCLGIALLVTALEKEDHTLLAVFAHPDDEFLISPLLARYAREGADVHLAIVTRGEKWAPQTPKSARSTRAPRTMQLQTIAKALLG